MLFCKGKKSNVDKMHRTLAFNVSTKHLFIKLKGHGVERKIVNTH